MAGPNKTIIDSLASSLAQNIDRRRWLFAVGPAILILLCLAGLLRFRVDNSLTVWQSADPLTAELQNEFALKSGVDDFIFVAWSAPDAMSPEETERSSGVRNALAALEGVERVFDGVMSARLLGADHPLVKGALLRRDEAGDYWLGVMALLQQDRAIRASELVELTGQALESFEPDGGFRLGGPVVLNNALDEASNQTIARLVPFTLVIIALILTLMFGSWRAPAVLLTGALLTPGAIVGLLGWLGQPGNMLLAVLPAFLIVIGLASGMHVVWHWRHAGGGQAERLRETISLTLAPGLLCAMTTSLGLLSLCLSRITPIVIFALAGTAGIALSLFLSFTLLPVLLTWSYPLPEPGLMNQPKLIGRPPWRFKGGRGVVVAFGLAVCVAALLAPRLQIQGSPLSFLPENAKVIRDYREIENHLVGLTPLQVVVTANEGEQADLNAVAARTLEELRQAPGIRLALDIDAMHLLPIFQAAQTERKYLLAFSETSASENLPMLEQQLAEAAGGKVYIVGAVASIIRMRGALLKTLIRSFAAMALGVSILLLLLLRRPRQAGAAIVANLSPAWIVLGLMALWRIPLDAATVMVLSVALGLAVDDTLHLLFHFQRAERLGKSRHEAVESALSLAGGPVIRTSVAAAAGFAVFALAGFRPIAQFGVLLSLAALIALAADLYLLPALLTGSWRKEPTK